MTEARRNDPRVPLSHLAPEEKARRSASVTVDVTLRSDAWPIRAAS
jgi:hypothetical protein